MSCVFPGSVSCPWKWVEFNLMLKFKDAKVHHINFPRHQVNSFQVFIIFSPALTIYIQPFFTPPPSSLVILQPALCFSLNLLLFSEPPSHYLHAASSWPLGWGEVGSKCLINPMPPQMWQPLIISPYTMVRGLCVVERAIFPADEYY